MKPETPRKIIEDALVGSSYNYVSVADWWCLSFCNGFWLVAQDVFSPEEVGLNDLLANAQPSVLDGVDHEYIAKGIVLHRNMRKELSSIALASDGSLRLAFDEDRIICLPTSSDVVDWQWCLNRSGKDPYSDYLVACFYVGEVELAEEEER
jgi:hypothetical protein